MTFYLRLGLVLLIIAAVASGVLAFVNTLTKPIIEENQRLAAIEARQEVLPLAVEFELIDSEFPLHVGYDEEDNIVGFTFIARGMGYSGVIRTMVGLDTDYKIENIKILEQSETPGLGANVTRPEFTNQFRGLTRDELVIDKDEGDVETITGATITTRTVVESSREAIEKFKAGLANIAEEAESGFTEEHEEAIRNFLSQIEEAA